MAVAVIRDGLRPMLPEEDDDNYDSSYPLEYRELMTTCWHPDPTIRPTFLEIMTRLSSMSGECTGGSYSSSSSSIFGDVKIHHLSKMGSSPSTRSSSSDGSFSDSTGRVAVRTHAPEGEVTIVFSDITRAASLWEFNAEATRDATLIHNKALRAALRNHRGYEVIFIRDRNSGEGSFCMAFQSAGDALAWCMEVQKTLLTQDWPEALLEHPGAAEEWNDKDDRCVPVPINRRRANKIDTNE